MAAVACAFGFFVSEPAGTTCQAGTLTPRGADVVYVRTEATGAGTGASWADAFTDLQAALAATGPGHQVWVAAGTYTPTPVTTPDRAVSFVMQSGIELYGGFAGTETSLAERDTALNPTILSGDILGDDKGNFENTTDNSYHVVVATGVDEAGILDGFTVRAGRSDGPSFGADPASKNQGSGVNIYYGMPIIRHCIIESNYSLDHGAVNDHGDHTLVQDCLFRDNVSGDHGGGLYIHHHSQTHAIGCLFERNVAVLRGGGMYSQSLHGAVVEQCYFRNNVADLGGGMYNAELSAAHVEDCTFFGNFANIGGGGIYTDITTVTIADCVFAENSAGLEQDGGGAGSGGSGGGGVWNTGGSTVIQNCTFSGNAASFGGGVYNIEDAATLVQDCFFIRNLAREAGGLYTLTSPVTVRRCVFQQNVAVGTFFSVGGGVSNYFSDAIVTECTFLGNHSTLGGGGLYNEGAYPTVSRCTFRGNAASGIENGTQGWGGAILNGYNTTATIADCEMVGNAARSGGAIFNLIFSSVAISNCTMLGNTTIVEENAFGGGAVYTYQGSNVVLRNCIAWNNVPDEIGGLVIDAAHSCIGGGYPGAGIFGGDPRLVRLPSVGDDLLWNTPDDDLGDLRPASGSPCIDAGENAAAGLGLFDVAGSPRLHDDPGTADTGVGTPPLVDIGAYEFQGTSCRADFNGDGFANSQDFFDFITAFFALQPAADFNHDTFINSQDFFDFLAAFFSGC